MYALPELNKIAANAGGAYVELETGADPNYDATGLMRVHVSNCATSASPAGCVDLYGPLGPSTVAQHNFWGKAQPGASAVAAAGVWWSLSTDASGVTRRLGNQTAKDVTAAVLTPYWNNTAQLVSFSVDYVLLAQGVLVTEAYALAATGQVNVTVAVQLSSPSALGAWLQGARALSTTTARTGNVLTLPPGGRPADPPTLAAEGGAGAGASITTFGVGFLALQTDGANATTLTVTPAARTASVAMAQGAGSGRQTFTAAPPPAGRAYDWLYAPSNPAVDTRNGPASVVDVALTGLPVGSQRESFVYALAAVAA